MEDLQHSIRVASRLTGLSPHVIRIWEKRYSVIEPARTGSNRRLYTSADIEKLTLLRKVTLAGHSIGNVAGLELEKLRSLVEQEQAHEEVSLKPVRDLSGGAEAFQNRCEQAMYDLNAQSLQESLNEAALAFGGQGLLKQIIAPLTHRIGVLWRDGKITAAHEHFASSIIRAFLFQANRGYYRNGNSPVMISATPAGQIHELGAVMVAAGAYNLGWRVTLLGADLPAAEIAGAAVQNQARLVALSIVYPQDDPELRFELEKLRQLLPDEVSILVGGQAAPSYTPVLDSIGAKMVGNLDDCFAVLDDLRSSQRSTSGAISP